MQSSFCITLAAAVLVSVAALHCDDAAEVADAPKPAAVDSGANEDAGNTTSCTTCFPLEKLEEPLATEAAKLLLAALDGEAIHTLIGETKPFSVVASEPAGADSDARLAFLESVAKTYTCTDRVGAFARKLDTKVELVVFRTATVKRVLDAHASVFTGLGGPDAPRDLLAHVEAAAPDTRARALALLFGEPDVAADFAASQANAPDSGAEFDVRNLPTWTTPIGGLSYRVAKGTPLGQAEADLFAASREVIVAYDHKRSNFIGPFGEGAPAMLRTFFADDSGRCSPESTPTSVARSREKHGACFPAPFDCTKGLSCCSLRCENQQCQ